MTRTEAPKDFVGRGEENLARTTPELPVKQCCQRDRPGGMGAVLLGRVYRAAG